MSRRRWQNVAMVQTHAELARRQDWMSTSNPYFPLAAKVSDQWWVLRVNCYPDHPLYTLFVGDERRFDLDDLPESWRRANGSGGPRLSAEEEEEATSAIREWIAYGSEVGRPCDNLFCCG